RLLGNRRVFPRVPLVDVVARILDVALAVELDRPHDGINGLSVFQRFGDLKRVVGTGALDPLGDRLNDAVAEEGEALGFVILRLELLERLGRGRRTTRVGREGEQCSFAGRTGDGAEFSGFQLNTD